MSPPTHWWGDHSLAVSQTGSWRLGDLAIWATRSATEWSFLYRYEEGCASDRAETRLPTNEAPPEISDARVSGRRIAFRSTTDSLKLRPALPDRPLVVRLEAPLTIPGGEVVCVYVGLPLWARFETGPSSINLIDIPICRVSDSWFGQLAGAGELCYASKTSARQDLAMLPPTQTRARAAVRIENRVESALSLETLRLPVGNLSLFSDDLGRLWTQTIDLIHEEEGESAALELGNLPPSHATGAQLLAGPRQTLRKRIRVLAFGNLFRGGIDALRSGKPRSTGMVDP